MKRIFDIVFALMVLVLTSPIILLFLLLVWLQDFKSPLYRAPRIGEDGLPFRMIKLRSMVANADKSGVSSTAKTDSRITRVGRIIRKYKLDELTQFWNVLMGTMSVVGPRPQVRSDVDLYTKEELRLLEMKPGITDMASIVFSDEGDILQGSSNPDLDYNRIIRPWKSRLGLLYIEKHNLALDLKLVFLTATAISKRQAALKRVQRILGELGAQPLLVRIAGRNEDLFPYPPPGATEPVGSLQPSEVA